MRHCRWHFDACHIGSRHEHHAFCDRTICILSACGDGGFSHFECAKFATTERLNNLRICYFPSDGTGGFLWESLRLQGKFAVKWLRHCRRHFDACHIGSRHTHYTFCSHSASVFCTCGNRSFSDFECVKFATTERCYDFCICHFPHDGTGGFLWESLRLQGKFAVKWLRHCRRHFDACHIGSRHTHYTFCSHSASVFCTCGNRSFSDFECVKFATTERCYDFCICHFPHDGTGGFLWESLRLQGKFAVEWLRHCRRHFNACHIGRCHRVLWERSKGFSHLATFCIDNLSSFGIND